VADAQVTPWCAPQWAMARRSATVTAIVAAALAALAAAMGIGRFAFTPLLPLMQAEGLTLGQGSWLAGANYLGYLVGALASFVVVPAPGASARGGLVATALVTLAMGFVDHAAAWFALRFAAGVASAFVLVGASGWAMAQLGARGAGARAGWVFGGVGAGIAGAGLAVLAGSAAGLGAPALWRTLGVAAAAVALLTWRVFGERPPPAPAAAAGAATLGPAAWTLVGAYGLFGLGYIVPATFIPAAARSLAADPAVFGWAWPLFGAAAFASTILVPRLWPRAVPRQVAAAGLWLMAAGVAAPALVSGMPALLFSALAVGGTFMVVTMAGMQEGRRLGGTRLMSGMTAAFALGQMIGPLTVRPGASAAQAIIGPSLAAAALLVVAAAALQRRFEERTSHVAEPAAPPAAARTRGDDTRAAGGGR
jgi:hypothetical protein